VATHVPRAQKAVLLISDGDVAHCSTCPMNKPSTTADKVKPNREAIVNTRARLMRMAAWLAKGGADQGAHHAWP
jgi:hypothetical protein